MIYIVGSRPARVTECDPVSKRKYRNVGFSHVFMQDVLKHQGEKHASTQDGTEN